MIQNLFMTKKPIPLEKIGIPDHFLAEEELLNENKDLCLFSLSSHARAKEAIEFGLKMRNKGYNIFVIAEDRCGRMSATMNYLRKYVKNLSAPNDWVYVNNFNESHRPVPFSLPSGTGKYLESRTKDLIINIWIIFNKLFKSPNFQRQIAQLNNSLEESLNKKTLDLQNLARNKGFEIISNQDGFSIEPLKADENFTINQKDFNYIKNKLNNLGLIATLGNQKIEKQINKIKQTIAKNAISPLFKEYKTEFGAHLKEWISEFKKDILRNVNLFFDNSENNEKIPKQTLERYAINLLVDNSNYQHPQVVLEPNPTYENLFGQIKYRNNEVNGGLETHFTMIRPGALHRANNGILVLRAESVANDENLWNAIKSALRDKKIIINERFREGSLPLDDAPSPKSIPLEVQVFLVASPAYYYNFLQPDIEFSNYFKIRAEIDSDLPATKENIISYQKLIKNICLKETNREIKNCAIAFLMGYASRWIGNREKLSSKFELIKDIIIEANTVLHNKDLILPIDRLVIEKTLENRRRRNSRFEEIVIEDIQKNSVLIDTDGKKVGLINGLTVLNLNDRTFGMPARISARTYVGSEGVINIERLTEMAGPIQQKGAFILEGFLKGIFAQKFPLSCSCSLTFEQNYSDVEGDSASMAELIVILSSLANIPVRQDIAITGSINQFGAAQVVGGIHQKIEGFYKVCKERGFTKTQGVIIPNGNTINLTVRPDVVEDIKNGNFKIWGVDNVFEAIEIILDTPCGITIDKFGRIKTDFEEESVFYKAQKTLQKFDKIMQKY